VVVSQSSGDNDDLWIFDTERGTKTRLTFDSSDDRGPVWTPDGRRIVYYAKAKNCSGDDCIHVLVRAADGTGRADTVAVGWHPSVTPDGRYAVYSMTGVDGWDIAFAPIDERREQTVLVQDEGSQRNAAVSPDGGYVAYTSTESGDREVYLKRFPSGEGKWQVSVAGGSWPTWDRSGNRLYYVVGDDIMEVEVTLGEAPRLARPRKLFTRASAGVSYFGSFPAGFDVTADADRFLVLRSGGGDVATQAVTVVQNWYAEFAHRR